MAGTVKGPAIFLAQFAGDAAPFNSFEGMCGWAASLGYKGVQIPAWDGRLIDLAKTCYALPSSEGLRRILSAAQAFAAGASQHDDMTLVVLRVS